MNEKPDLDRPETISDFIESFYSRLLQDDELAPVFLEAAQIDLQRHLPRIKAFWRKLLLGETGYNHHMMNIHRDLHQRHPFTASNFSRWLNYFESTLDASYEGPYAERARKVARSIATNLQEALLHPGDFTQRTRYIENRAHPIAGRKRKDLN